MHRWVDAAKDAGADWYRPLGSYKQRSAVPEPWVYFMRRERLVKIGTTYDLTARAATLNAVILAKTPGSYAEEKRIHARFADLRRHGEWFEPGPPLLQLINELRRETGMPPLNA